MVTVTASTIKNKASDLSDDNSYMPTALAASSSKLYETLILITVNILTTCVNRGGSRLVGKRT